MMFPAEVHDGRWKLGVRGIEFPDDLGVECRKCKKELRKGDSHCAKCGDEAKPIPAMSQSEWKGVWPSFRAMNASINFILGDWINYGMRCWGEKYALALDATDLEYQTLRIAAHVCRKVPLFLRRNNLDWSHHKEVSHLDHKEQAAFLTKAESNEWSVSQLRLAIRSHRGDLNKLPKMPKTFSLQAWAQEGLRWLRQKDFESMETDRKQAIKRTLEPFAKLYAQL